jgi:hypothetical protein
LDTKELEAVYLLHYSFVIVDGGVPPRKLSGGDMR